MNDQPCRWGILGAAEIAGKNWHAIQLAQNAVISAVASRSADKAQAFIDQCQSSVPVDPAPQPLASYEELLARDDVDAVYIPLPTGLRKEWVIRAAQAGKSVLVEKPCGATADDVREMVAACSENGVQFMDGVMFMHSRRLDAIRQVLDRGAVGKIKRITSHHAFAGPEAFFQENIRLHSQLEPQGCLGDLGWYSIRFILWALNWQLPRSVRANMLSQGRRSDSPGEVPTELSAELLFDDGVSAQFYCSFLTENQQWANIGGTEGFLVVPDFVLPFFGNEMTFEVNRAAYRIDGCDFVMERHTREHAVEEYANNAAGAQEVNMITRLSELATRGPVDPHWGRISIQTQQVLDACLQSAQNGSELVTI